VTRLLGLIAVLCASAPAQAPVIGDINFYGLRSLTAERVLNSVHLKPGDPIPPSKGELEDRVADLPGVVLARIEAVCCEGPKAILFIGIEEHGAPHPAFRSPPSGDATLPADLINDYGEFLGAVQRAAGRGNASEDLTSGHSLMADPAARFFQERFVAFAGEHLDQLRGVLKNGAEADQRAIAAAVIGYAPNKQDVANDLQSAVQDPDESVRANAIRSLNAFAVSGLRIAPTWFLELLNSVVLSDRVESVRALLTLTDKPAPEIIQQIRDRLPALAEMARWKTPRYALPPFLLLGRAAGLTDQQTQQSWQKGDRDAVIEKAMPAPLKKRQAALQ
jgi:hypothetical protein